MAKRLKFQSRAGGHYPPVVPAKPKAEIKEKSKSVKNKKEGGDK